MLSLFFRPGLHTFSSSFLFYKKGEEEDGKEEKRGISLLPGRGPSQLLEAWLRVTGEDDVPG